MELEFTDHIGRGVLLNFLYPLLDIVKALVISDVVQKHDAHDFPVVPI